MNKKINNIDDLTRVVIERWTELEDIPVKYLSVSGIAAKESYRSILWHLGFHDSIASLREDEGFMNLVNIPDKDPEFYKIIRSAYRAIDRILENKDK